MSKIDELMAELACYLMQDDGLSLQCDEKFNELGEEITKLQQAVTPGASLNYLVAQVEALGASCDAGPLVNSTAWLATKAGIVELQQVLTTTSALVHSPKPVEPPSQELREAVDALDEWMRESFVEEYAAAWVVVRAALPWVTP